MCDVNAAIGQHCNSSFASMIDRSLRWRGERALFIQWRLRSGLQNQLGVGHMLLAACRLHALCFRVRRYCYLELYDLELEDYFSFAHGGRWKWSGGEAARYKTSARLELSSSRSDTFEQLIEAKAQPLIPGDRVYDPPTPNMPLIRASRRDIWSCCVN